MKKPIILDGKICAEHYYETFPKGIKGEFHIITVGDDPASKVYVRNKIKACERLGITPVHKVFSSNIDLLDIYDYIYESYCTNSSILGTIVQLPLPKEVTNKNNIKISDLVPPYLDVDGFSSNNLKDILIGNTPEYYPATPKGIMMLLDYYNINVDGKHVVVINRSDIVGKPLAAMMLKRNATVTVCHSHTKNLEEIIRTADIIVTAVGKPKFINSHHVANFSWDFYNDEEMVTTKHPIIIDVAMCRDENDKLCGDVDFEDVKPYVSAITPVPGGVGPMTVCALMSNLVESYKSKNR